MTTGVRIQEREREIGAPISRLRKGEGRGMPEMGGAGGDGGTQEKQQQDSATAVPGDVPRASRGAWEHEGRCFPLVSRLNCVADKDAV